MKTSSLKYEITDIAHEKYPFLHRIRALQDIGEKVKAGDLGGFVESKNNLSVDEDTSWIFGDAIAAGSAIVDQGACLYGNAIACGSAYVSLGAALSGDARAEDFAFVRGAVLCGHARASGQSMVLNSPDTGEAPILSEHCTVYGTVLGDVHIMGDTVVLENEKFENKSLDTLVINGQQRSVIRDPSRDELKPCQPPQIEEQHKKPQKKKQKGQER